MMDLERMPQNKAVGLLSRMVKGKKRAKIEQAPARRRIEPATFTEFVAAHHAVQIGEVRLRCRSFELDDEWEADIERAVSRGPRQKAVGVDDVFMEAFQASSEVTAAWIAAVWRSYGRCCIIPTAWTRSVLCPLLKKEPADNPLNWRAVILLSHARKTIEKVLDGRLRAKYTFQSFNAAFEG